MFQHKVSQQQVRCECFILVSSYQAHQWLQSDTCETLLYPQQCDFLLKDQKLNHAGSHPQTLLEIPQAGTHSQQLQPTTSQPYLLRKKKTTTNSESIKALNKFDNFSSQRINTGTNLEQHRWCFQDENTKRLEIWHKTEKGNG